jgi:hypothetical protein
LGTLEEDPRRRAQGPTGSALVVDVVPVLAVVAAGQEEVVDDARDLKALICDKSEKFVPLRLADGAATISEWSLGEIEPLTSSMP